MTVSRSDALLFFGATGDLAYKQIFPALQALIRRDHLDMPVVGVARSKWSLDQFKARAKDSLEKHGRLDPRRTRSFAPCWFTSTGIMATRQLL